ncbi:hypothetical protein ACTXT7_015884 [Hymenolepis weldensis]
MTVEDGLGILKQLLPFYMRCIQFLIDYDIDYLRSNLSADPSSPELRRRGQLNLWVQVAAIRLSSASCQQLLVPPSSEPPSPSKDKKRQSPPSKYPKHNTELDETCDAVKK